MLRMTQPLCVLTLLLGASAGAAQKPTPAAKSYEVPKDGLHINGKLTKDDPPLANAPVAALKGAPHQVFLVKLVKGQSYVMELVSNDFDAYLILQNALGTVRAHDDDSGGELNSRIVHVAAADGAYRVVAASLDHKPGAFQIRIRAGELAPQDKQAADADKLRAQAVQLNAEIVKLFQRGDFRAAVVRVQQSLTIVRQLYPAAKYPDGHVQVANALDNLGLLFTKLGEHDAAKSNLEQALTMYRKLYPGSTHPDGHADLARTLTNLHSLYEAMQLPEKALSFAEQALAMRQRLYPSSKHPDGHFQLANSLSDVGGTLQSLGLHARALPYLERCLTMRQALYPETKFPDGHAQVALAANELAMLHKEMGRYESALRLGELALTMRRRLFPPSKYPDGHTALASSLNAMGGLLEMMGAPEKALPLFEEALAMRRRLYPAARYPDGTPQLSTSLNNLGFVYDRLGAHDKALAYYEQAVALEKKLYPTAKYPHGHPNLANSMDNLSFALAEVGSLERALHYRALALEMRQQLYPASKYPAGHRELADSLQNMSSLFASLHRTEEALAYCKQALAMRRALYPVADYPDGHPQIAQSLINLGAQAMALDQMSDAKNAYRESLAMLRKLYPPERFPDGHPTISTNLSNLGSLHFALGQPAEALPLLQEALAMQERQARRLFASASEGEALAFLQTLPAPRDGLLSVTRDLADAVSPAYRAVWFNKASIMRVLQARHTAALAAASDLGTTLDDLKAARRSLDQLLQDRQLPPAERDAQLAKATARRDALERMLAEALPGSWLAQGQAEPGPEQLAPLLPENAIFIDFVRYGSFYYDRSKPGKVSTRGVFSYAAFVIAGGTPGRAGGSKTTTITRVELGAVAPMDKAIARWRRAIETRQDPLASSALHERLWSKLAPHVPAGTKTLYLGSDGELSSLPWAALPIGKERLLLEKFAVAQVPHGPFLLEHLKHPHQAKGANSLLTVGDIDYGKTEWPALPGAKAEIDALQSLAPAKRLTLVGAQATPKALVAALARVQYAHLATHGEFQAESLAAERKRTDAAQTERSFGSRAAAVASKNPAGYVGLVLSGGEVMSGLSIVDQDLRNTKLVTLSACETALGDYTMCEGVQGLQRAFHIAGCPNVVASLWKVNDAATAALMSKFYHEIWVNKKPPIEALREAQLTIYRHPELIPDLAGERGAVRLRDAVAAKTSGAASARRATADTKLWAAFVLSGVGK